MTTATQPLPTAQQGGPEPKLLGLQMLRGFAALMVVYSHLMERVVLRGFVAPSDWWLNLDVGRFGVCVFFAISGFVMIHSCRSKFGQPDYGGNVKKFLIHRFARIYPLYLLTTLVFIPFLYFTKHEYAHVPRW